MPTFANTIDNNEILAKRSQCDYAGKDIQTTYATKSEVTTGLASKQDTISDLATIRSGAADGATAVQPGDLATVATTGAYSDLSGTPTIPPALSAGNGIDITNNVVSADLDGTSLTNGANGLSVTLPVPDTTGASQGDVLSVGQSGIEWVPPGGGGGDAVLTYNVSTWSDFITAYNAGKNIRAVETYNGVTYEYTLHEYNPNGTPSAYAIFTTTKANPSGSSVQNRWCQIYASDSWTNGSVSIQGNLSGQGAISVNPDTRRISLELDGSSLTQSNSGLAVANPLPSTLGTAGQVLTVNAGATGVEWATPSGGGSVTDVEVNGTSVVNASGVAEVTVPAQVQPDWDATSGLGEILNKPTIPAAQVNSDWNASSGVAEILNKPTILPYKPVVAGTGVRIVNDTANNRIVVEADETVLWEGSLGSTGSSKSLSESIFNFKTIEIHCWPNKSLITQRAPQIFRFGLPTATGSVFLYCRTQNLESGIYYSEVIYVNVSNGTSFQLAQGHRWQDNTQTKSIDDYRGSVCKIVGIHRIASN